MLALALALCLDASTEPAARPSEAVALRWDAPAPCPTEDEVRTSLDAMLRGAAPPEASLSVDAQVTGANGAYVLDLTVASATSRDTRTIRATRCESLGRATALVVATLVDPVSVADYVVQLETAVASGATSRSVPEPVEPVSVAIDVPAPAPPPEPPPEPPPQRSASRASPRRDALQGALRVEGLAGRASLPRVDGGLALAAGLVLPHARVELGAVHLFAQAHAHPDRDDVSLRIAATQAVLRACGVPGVGRWEFPLCAGGEIGVMSARGQGAAVSRPAPVRSPYGTVLVEAHAVWRATPRIALWVGAQGLVAVARPRFTVGTLPPFFTAPAGGGRAALALEVRFP